MKSWGPLLISVLVAAVPLAGQRVSGGITFNKDVAPVLFAHCAPCHRPGEAAPFPLLTFADARNHSAQILQATGNRYMPPWMPEAGHGDFAGSPRLTDSQIATLREWVRGGMAEGNPADLPALPRFTEGWQLGKPDLILRMRRPFALPATGGDVFRNFVLPSELKETRYIRAFELRPGNKRVVHHANVILDRSRLLRNHDGQDGQPGFAGMDVITEASGEFDPDSHFLFWKPGSPAQQEPEEMPWKLDPGTDLIVNLHLQPSGKPETVEAEIGLWFSAKPPAQHPMLVQLEHDGAINIPPGSATATVTDHVKLPVAVSVLAVYPHAHYLGKEFEAWAQMPSGARVPLLKISHWDINWQATYTYRKPVALPAGTTLNMRITYDNTAANPRNPANPPKRVVAGNRSDEEMGHVWFQVLPAAGPAGDDPRVELQQAVMRRRLEKYPADFIAHFNIGAILQGQGRPEEARQYLSEAVRIRPENASARNNLGVALFSSEKLAEAAQEFREALRLDPSYENARYNLARTLAAGGDIAGAIREVEACLVTQADDGGVQELAGRLYGSSGNLRASLPHFRRAADLEPDNPSYLINLGAALASSGDPAAAIPVFEKVLRLDPSNAVARDYLERARRQRGSR